MKFGHGVSNLHNMSNQDVLMVFGNNIYWLQVAICNNHILAIPSRKINRRDGNKSLISVLFTTLLLFLGNGSGKYNVKRIIGFCFPFFLFVT